ncbi:MAG: hypothetical protein ACK5NX_02460 [Armatimonadota bacterium]
MADARLSQILGSARRATYLLTSTNTSLAIPSWAQNGKSIVLVTACGGGAGGASGGTAGGGAACAVEFPLAIPSGAATMSVTIGAAGVTGASVGAGGDTTIAIGGTNAVQLAGGTTTGGRPRLWSVPASAWRDVNYGTGTSTLQNIAPIVAALLVPGGATLSAGVGGSSLFGANGAASTAAVGFGAAGGSGANGAPGFALLTFVEGA